MDSSNPLEDSNKVTTIPSSIYLGADYLSRFLNKLPNHPDYHYFYMGKRGPHVNHLIFVDDIILFTSGRCKTLKILMHTLKTNEETSGILINGYKSFYGSLKCIQ